MSTPIKKSISIILAGLVAFLTYSLATDADPTRRLAWIALGSITAATVLGLGWLGEGQAPSAARGISPSVPPSAPIGVAPTEPSALDLLSVLQAKGRLVDFLMDDVSKYSDAQVAAAARVVHRGCAAVIREHLALKPLLGQNEGSEIEIPPGYSPGEFRLTGSLSGSAPYRGRVVHRGWELERVDIPRHVVDSKHPNRSVVAPAEIEV